MINKCLNKNGILYIEVPNLFGLPMFSDSHLSSFTLDSLKKNLLNLDFYIIKSGYSHSDKDNFNYGVHYISDIENIYIIVSYSYFFVLMILCNTIIVVSQLNQERASMFY